MSNGIECGGSGLARNRCLTNQGTLIRVFAVVFLLCVDRERGRVHVILNRKDHLWLEFETSSPSFSKQQHTTNIAVKKHTITIHIHPKYHN